MRLLNKFGQVSSLGYQMSLSVDALCGGGGNPRGNRWDQGARPCTGNAPSPEQTATTENITFPQLPWRMVKTHQLIGNYINTSYLLNWLHYKKYNVHNNEDYDNKND